MQWTLHDPAPGVRVAQPARGGPGYRYASEVFWLVGFALEGGVPATALDLGSGSGIAAWLLAGHGVDVQGVESWPDWAEGWGLTARHSEVSGRVRMVRSCVTAIGSAPTVDLVVSNPPYWPASQGHTAADPWRRAARTPSTASVADFARIARQRAGDRGRVCFVVPRAREEEARRGLGSVRRRVAVGRVLVLLEAGGQGPSEDVAIGEGDARVHRWIQHARRMEHR